jgi:wyosine [tRNA(Phe)-imidazoG37] synthetase (radical SAM superfamily)
VAAVDHRLRACADRGERVDTITLVPDGEPTLDAHVGQVIRALGSFGLPVAVITNGSLLWRDDVRADLTPADIVSVKVDTVDDRTWRRLNRPSARLQLAQVLEGIRAFADEYAGTLLTETMLVHAVNDASESVVAVADFVRRLRPASAYLAAPTRPPAVHSAVPPSPDVLVRAYELMAERLPHIALLGSEPEGHFGQTGDPVADLLGILAVHPMREERARDYLVEAGGTPAALDALVEDGRIVIASHAGHRFAMPSFPTRREPA